jgi:hypothetical protein
MLSYENPMEIRKKIGEEQIYIFSDYFVKYSEKCPQRNCFG